MKLNKILIVLPDAIGDFLVITPFLETLKRTYPASVLGVVASGRNIELARNNPHVDAAYLLDVRKKRTLPTLLWQVKKQKYELLIDLWLRRFSSSLKFFVKFSGIPHKFAIQKQGRFRSLRYAEYYDTVFPLAHGPVRMAYNNILAELDAPPVTERMRNIYPVPPAKLEQARQYVKHPCVVLVCEGSRRGNTLPRETCVEIIEGLTRAEPGLHVFLSSSPGAGNIASGIAASLGRSDVQALPDLDGSLDFTAAVLSLSDAVISTSTGTLHIADAFDIPTVGVYPKDYSTSLTPEYSGYYHFLPLTTRRAVIYSDNEHDSFPVEVKAIVAAAAGFLKAR